MRNLDEEMEHQVPHLDYLFFLIPLDNEWIYKN